MLHTILLAFVGLLVPGIIAASGDSSGATGIILDSRGRPVPNAEVYIADLRSNHDWCIESKAANSSIDHPVRSAITDAEGRFSISNLEAGRARLAVRAKGHVTLRLERIFLEALDVTELGPYSLEEGAQLKAFVTDRQDIPVENARIYSFPDRASSQGLGARTAALETTSDLRGAFETNTLPLGEWTILIEAEGFAAQRFEGTLLHQEHQGSPLQFRLSHSHAIRGRVTTLASVRDLSELLIRGIPIEEFDLERPDPTLAQGYVTASVERAGGFQLGPLRPDTLYLLRAQKKSQSFTVKDAWAPTALVMSGSANAQLKWFPSSKVSFSTSQVFDGKAPKEVRIELLGTSHEKPILQRSEDKNRTIKEVRPAHPDAAFHLIASGNGYREFQSRKLKLVPGETTQAGDVPLSEHSTLTVKVIDSKSKAPIPRARVVLKQTESIPAPRKSAEGQTSPNGVLTINQFPGTPMVLGIAADDYAPRVFQSPFESLSDVLLVELDPGLSLSVNVHNSDGSPVAGEGVRARFGRRFNQFAFEGTQDETRLHHTNEKGTAWFRGLASLEYSFELTNWDPNASTSLPQNLTPVEGPMGQVRFGLDSRTTLVGKILEDGFAVNSAEFRLDGLRVRTDEGGNFRLDDVHPGHHPWVATHPDRVLSHTGAVFLDVSDNLFEFDLPVTILEGVVRDALSAPVGGASLHLSANRWQEDVDLETLRGENLFRAARESRSPELGFTSLDGFFSLKGVPEALGLTLSARTQDGFVAFQRVRDIRAGAVISDIELQLQPPVSLFIPALNQPLRSEILLALVATFQGEAQAGIWMRVLAPYKGQSWRLGGLPAGSWEIARVALSDFGEVLGVEHLGRIKLEPGERGEYAIDR